MLFSAANCCGHKRLHRQRSISLQRHRFSSATFVVLIPLLLR